MRKKGISDRPAVSAGFLRVGNDFDSDLRVKLVAVDDQLSLMTETVELGVWPSAAVVVEQVGDDRFSLRIDGESLDFFPDNPPEFLAQDIGTRPRRWTRKRTRSQRPAAPHSLRHSFPYSRSELPG